MMLTTLGAVELTTAFPPLTPTGLGSAAVSALGSGDPSKFEFLALLAQLLGSFSAVSVTTVGTRSEPDHRLIEVPPDNLPAGVFPEMILPSQGNGEEFTTVQAGGVELRPLLPIFQETKQLIIGSAKLYQDRVEPKLGPCMPAFCEVSQLAQAQPNVDAVPVQATLQMQDPWIMTASAPKEVETTKYDLGVVHHNSGVAKSFEVSNLAQVDAIKSAETFRHNLARITAGSAIENVAMSQGFAMGVTDRFSLLPMAHDTADAAGIKALLQSQRCNSCNFDQRDSGSVEVTDFNLRKVAYVADTSQEITLPHTVRRSSSEVSVVSQIAHAIVQHEERIRQETPVTVRLRLDPPDLGGVHIQLRLRGNTMEARLEVENPATQLLLEHQSSQLRDALGQSGISVKSLVISFQGGETRQQPHAEANEPMPIKKSNRMRLTSGISEQSANHEESVNFMA